MTNLEILAGRLARLEKDFEVLLNAMDTLLSSCQCSVKERMNGHAQDCPVPLVKDIVSRRFNV